MAMINSSQWHVFWEGSPAVTSSSSPPSGGPISSITTLKGLHIAFKNGELSPKDHRVHLIAQELLKKNFEKTANYFQIAASSNNPSTLKQFTCHIPKTDLHLHIDGSIPPGELLKAAAARKLLCYNKEEQDQIEFLNTPSNVDLEVAASKNLVWYYMEQDKLFVCLPKKDNVDNSFRLIYSVEALQTYGGSLIDKFYDITCFRSVHLRKEGDHKRFFRAFNTLESLARCLPLQDRLTLLLLNTDERVRYLEPSIWFEKDPLPKDFEQSFNEIYDKETFNLEKALSLIEKLEPWTNAYIERVRLQLDGCKKVLNKELLAKGFNPDDLFDLRNPHVLRFIIDNDRTLPSLAAIFANMVGSMLLQQEDYRIVGSGFAGAEHDIKSQNNFHDHMKIIKVLKEWKPHSNLSIHAGEVTKELAGEKYLRTCVRETVMACLPLEGLGALRLGHACAIDWDPHYPELLSLMNFYGILIELSLTSNEFVLGLKNGKHQINLFLDHMVPFSFCTDDQGVFNTFPASELQLAAQRYNKDKRMSNEKQNTKFKEELDSLGNCESAENEEVALQVRPLGYMEIKKATLNSIKHSFLRGESIYEKDNDKDGNLILKPLFRGTLECPLENIEEEIAVYLAAQGGWPTSFDRELMTKFFESYCTPDQYAFIKGSEMAKMELTVLMEFIYFELVVVSALGSKRAKVR